MYATIYQPAKNAMQSGRKSAPEWFIKLPVSKKNPTDEIMGWSGQKETISQLRLKFSSVEAAKDYVLSLGLQPIIEQPQSRKIVIKSYAENFTTKP